MIAKVEPLTQARALRGPFDYLLPERMRAVSVGSMLLVPFGRRRLLGVVVDLAEHSDISPERLVEPLEALDDGVPPELVRLGLWVADEYCSTHSRGLALVLPPGTGTGRPRRVGAAVALTVEASAAGTAALAGEGVERLGVRQRAALEALASGPSAASTLTALAGCDHGTLRSLERRGLVELRRERRRRRPEIAGVGAPGEGGADPTRAQAAALARVVAALDEDHPGERRLLLHGVTGSGKTEVYLRAVAAALERGRSAIVLVPEIALTPQTASRFERRFGDRVALLHSGLSAGERHDEWERLRSGEARLCVGPRSAVFAPVSELGLIVVDEEHDASYKQESDPRYDARRVAERRAGQAGAVLLAGSATPRPESYRRLERISLPERVDGRPLPPVELVGMAGTRGPLHERTRAALERVRERGEKAIVLLNRRGWSNFLSCRDCGRAWECPDCDVALVLHRSAAHMACHHCGHAQPVPEACPACSSVSVARHGAGTERLEAELEQLVAPLGVFRLDADSGGGRSGALDLLRAFDRAEAGVLVGTQMVAKGHDFQDVTLGVVLDADSTLRFPDFRAEERAFSLVAQLAGRSGRGARGGWVIVQALDPSARALRHAAAHDSDGFLEGELERRALLGYPPFADLIRVVCAASEEGPEARAAAALAERIELPGGRVLGPVPLFRRAGRWRSQAVVKTGDLPAAVRSVRAAVQATASERAHHGVSFSVDVDPH